MIHKVGAIVLIVIVSSIGWMAWGSQKNTAVPDDHGASLIAACRDALDHCDTDAFLALIYTGDTAEGRDLSAHRMMFEADCHKPVSLVTIDSLESSDVTSYKIKGVSYQPTRPPAGKLVIHFASNPNAAVHDEVTTYLVGQSNGNWRILTAEPDR